MEQEDILVKTEAKIDALEKEISLLEELDEIKKGEK